ncbi:MAG: hypothetical protein JXR94_22875 [Candidatus Hydrogenedentes bacterium]|nr:hypothetical protein [Candidatus Hydrogenedentota bacterium]
MTQLSHPCILAAFFAAVVLLPAVLRAQEASAQEPIDIGNRLELFVDRHLIAELDGVELCMHRPQPLPLPASPLPIAYTTVIKDGDLYRAYYRDYRPGYEGPFDDGNRGEITCYAESRDGHEWTFPDVGIFDVASSRGGNVILAGAGPCSHNFSPFLDTRPGVASDARLKALAGTHPGGGLYAFKSSDGIHWDKIQDGPVMTSGPFAFDSQNVSFWSEVEGCYVCYFRTWQTPHCKLRTISRTTSDDYLSWSEPAATNPNVKGEHLYTSQTHPYFRAKHIYIALPTRFFPERGESTDILFMATRAGSSVYERLFTEAYIRPGLDPARWGNRSNYVALNVVPTGPEEMSIYHKSGHRYVLRTDGFVSVRAGAAPGELLTKTLRFAGKALVVNYSTSGAGSLQVEIQGEDGTPVPGFSLDDCPPIVGDKIEQVVQWNGDPALGALAGKPVRLRFVMLECDLYSLRFASN